MSERIKESQPATEADVERVARAIYREYAERPTEESENTVWPAYVSQARAAIIAMGHTLAEEKTDE